MGWFVPRLGVTPGRARRAGEAIFARSERLLAEKGLEPFRETSLEVVGGGDIVGEKSMPDAATEVVVKEVWGPLPVRRFAPAVLLDGGRSRPIMPLQVWDVSGDGAVPARAAAWAAALNR